MADAATTTNGTVPDSMTPPPIPMAPKKSSGYRRLQARHRDLVAAHDYLKAEHHELLEAQEALQGDIDKLLAEHRRLMQTVRAPQPQQPNWYEGANLVLAQLAANP